MVRSRHTDLDIIEELQLRRWARENYIPANERGTGVHPIIAEEMQRKDAEAIINARSREPLSSFVPLAPTMIQKLHTDHQLPETPKMLQQRDRREEPVIAGEFDVPQGQWIC